MNWHHFTRHIQSRINDAVFASASDPLRHPLTRCAAVCKEWQRIFEKKIYQRLMLNQSCLVGFEKILSSTPQRRSCIQHINLRIELRRYTGLDCARFVVPPPIRPNNGVFKAAVVRLFLFLNT
ncbi:hypothetical protein S40285_06311 [Stachybotrys chlorohalonatus IBT 40285]|uniref:F-box domain-containing protein n=1 Tax=Stachybotrys chlorohalonatus (strain IBT 40285) TaxID=1283841 RepID=A0A084Q9Y7_STAC4|nr:hypothetical protein S40285_06311 [Stachybotrys chlorohalonata IBT 40285]